MSEPKDGGQAFPGNHVRGMSLRDWFAGEAMTGMGYTNDYANDTASIKAIAESAYRVADAMLAARAKPHD